MSLAQLLFSFRGRIGRAPFWGYVVAANALCVPAILLDVAFPEADDEIGPASLYLAGFCLVNAWPALAIQAKRWHDRDKSGWWTLINLVPVVGPLWSLVENGFLRGTPGPNRFGAPAVQRAEEAGTAA